MKIEELNLSMRTFNCLCREGITTVEELQEKHEDEIMSIRGMGNKMITEIRIALERLENGLPEEVPVETLVEALVEAPAEEPKEVPAIDKYNENIGTIKKLLIDAAMDFCAVGYYLKEIRDNEQYKEAGYSTIWECAQAEFGLSKSAASRHMTMNDMYSVGGNSAELDKKYISFNKSQLQEMLSLPESEREKVTPTTTVTEIRKLNPNSKASKEPVAALQHPEVTKEVHTPPAEQITKPEPIVLSELDKGAFGEAVEDNSEVVAISQQVSTKKIAPMERGCITGKSKYGVCSCCGNDGTVECCAQCSSSCNSRCGWLDEEKNEETVIDGAYREVVEETPAVKQLEFPVLKNMEEREQFIRDYMKWPVWCKNELTEETFYRFDLPDGSAIVVRSYLTWLDWRKEDRIHERYYLLKPGYKHFADTECNMTFLKDHLKEVQKNRK